MKRVYHSPALYVVTLHAEDSLLLTLSGHGEQQPNEGPQLDFGGNASDHFGGSPFEAE